MRNKIIITGFDCKREINLLIELMGRVSAKGVRGHPTYGGLVVVHCFDNLHFRFMDEYNRHSLRISRFDLEIQHGRLF